MLNGASGSHKRTAASAEDSLSRDSTKKKTKLVDQDKNPIVSPGDTDQNPALEHAHEPKDLKVQIRKSRHAGYVAADQGTPLADYETLVRRYGTQGADAYIANYKTKAAQYLPGNSYEAASPEQIKDATSKRKAYHTGTETARNGYNKLSLMELKVKYKEIPACIESYLAGFESIDISPEKAAISRAYKSGFRNGYNGGKLKTIPELTNRSENKKKTYTLAEAESYTNGHNAATKMPKTHNQAEKINVNKHVDGPQVQNPIVAPSHSETRFSVVPEQKKARPRKPSQNKSANSSIDRARRNAKMAGYRGSKLPEYQALKHKYGEEGADEFIRIYKHNVEKYLPGGNYAAATPDEIESARSQRRAFFKARDISRAAEEQHASGAGTESPPEKSDQLSRTQKKIVINDTDDDAADDELNLEAIQEFLEREQRMKASEVGRNGYYASQNGQTAAQQRTVHVDSTAPDVEDAAIVLLSLVRTKEKKPS